MTLLSNDSEDSSNSATPSDDSEDSSDIALWGSVHCPVPVRVSVLVRSVPSALATIKGLKGLKGPKGILSDYSDDSSDFALCDVVSCPCPGVRACP